MLALAGTPLEYLSVALYCGDPAALGLQDRPLHMLQQITDGVDVGSGQVINLVLGLGSDRVGIPTRVSSPALPWLIHPL